MRERIHFCQWGRIWNLKKKTVKDTVIKKSSENNEEPHKAHIDTIIRSLKKMTLNLPVTSQFIRIALELWRHRRLQPQFSSDLMIKSVCGLWGSSFFFCALSNESVFKNSYSSPLGFSSAQTNQKYFKNKENGSDYGYILQNCDKLIEVKVSSLSKNCRINFFTSFPKLSFETAHNSCFDTWSKTVKIKAASI